MEKNIKIYVNETQLRLIKINAKRAIERNKRMIEDQKKSKNLKGKSNTDYYIIEKLVYQNMELEDLINSVDIKINLKLIKT